MRALAAAVILLLLAACAEPQQQTYLAADYSPYIRDGAFHPGDGSALPVKQWMPKNRHPRGIVIALHGFNDYRKAFALPGAYLAQRGIMVVAYDQRGFGKTEQTGIWGNRENFLSDLSRMVMLMRREYPRTPVFIMGESMGGAIAIVAAAEPGFPQPDGLILSAPALWGGDALNPLYRFTLALMVRTVPDREVTGEGLKIQATDNIPLLREMGADPLIQKKARVDAVYGLVNLMDEAFLRVPEVRVPVLLIYGQKDQVIPRYPVLVSVERLQTEHTFIDYEGGWHMLMRDLEREQVYEDIMRWLKPRLVQKKKK